ncbi:membrane or secreted protein [Roseivirga sp. E12]|uniref:membrane or secreted protein n=1 Tax=Roseivirga sp. E12 TaxID=2819237 RepID=UPI001ABD2B10|nr:membrane or secreted protein [Roseivirga sp. E12]MBO3699207.1 membrane or secreted protein [Roseivirga sp. E12]
MKTLSTLLIVSISLLMGLNEGKSTLANALEGAWEIESVNGEKLAHRGAMLIQAPYAFYTEFDVEKKTFVGSQGGMIEITGNKVSLNVEFDTWNPDHIGVNYEITASLRGSQVTLNFEADGQSFEMKLNRTDNGSGDLAGAWRITDRMRNGEMQAMRLGARKTIKMITGTRFQWAAFNPETKQFSGTGGGTVILENGKYNEHIEFFSRNPDRVGADLSFDYKVDGNKWDHSGLSSTGNPIREIWTKQ